MATSAVIPGMAGGAVTGAKNAGIPVPGNTMGLNQTSPIMSGNARASVPGGGTSGVTGTPPASTGLPYFQPPGSQNTAQGTNGQVGAVNPTALTPTAPVSSTATNADGNPNASLTADQNKQLTDIYGQGTGSLLSGLIGNLGSNDSSYMQAYNAAMSKQTAEGAASLNTSLGNAGISANSSASAIENADYQTGVTAQAGLQEQQLLQTQSQQEIGLVQGVQGASAQEVGTSWLTDAGEALGVAGTVAGDVLGTGGIGSLLGGTSAAIPSITNGAQQTLPSVYGGGPPSMPANIPGTSGPSLSGLDF
ncbi:MAG TPA: hypothetical protein VGF75_05575 [Candidatus Saccharimonadales bacterium]|jgi:hypothetical protein